MHHAFVDEFANLKTPLHSVRPKAKAIFYFIILVAIVFSPIEHSFLFLSYGIFVALLIIISKIPLKFFLKRIIQILPFIVIISLASLFRKDANQCFLSCTTKSFLAVSLTLVLSATTKFTQLLEALKELRVPSLFIRILSFMYRYSFLLEDEFLRTKRAYESRAADSRNNFRKARAFGNIIGVVFVHTYERAERIYLAMCARGYNGEEGNPD